MVLENRIRKKKEKEIRVTQKYPFFAANVLTAYN
jgi:hypothetical protein